MDPTGIDAPDVGSAPIDAARPVPPAQGRRLIRLAVRTLAAVALTLLLVAAGAEITLVVAGSADPSPQARGTGHDGLWIGHAWVDGRRTQADVDALATRLRGTGIHDLFVHTGPFRDDGTLDVGLRPRARWLTGALHAALPGVRVQAWLGAHPTPQELRLDSPQTRSSILAAVSEVLADGFDGIHYDFEPVADGDPSLITMLRDTRSALTNRHAVLSVSTIHNEPWPGMVAIADRMPGTWALWSGDYLHRVALEVDQVAVMSYDTGLLTEPSYRGYLREATRIALDAVPPNVSLLMGVPAYHDEHLTHHQRAETVAAALRGVRLAMGDETTARTGSMSSREFGVALYVDFAATDADWAAYHDGWVTPPPSRPDDDGEAMPSLATNPPSRLEPWPEWPASSSSLPLDLTTREDRRPADAWWVESDNEWVHGHRDAAGLLTGAVRYWDPDDFLISECDHVDGQPHGVARRFFRDGHIAEECHYVDGRIDGVRSCYVPADPIKEPVKPGYGNSPWWHSAPPEATAYECLYHDGEFVGARFRDADGVEVDSFGDPVPPRPVGVAPTAMPTDDDDWRFTAGEGERGWPLREAWEWHADGQLALVRERDGRERAFHPNGRLWRDGSRRGASIVDARTGRWRFFDGEGVLRRESHYDDAGAEVARVWHRTDAESGGHGTRRHGPVANDAEVGEWTVDDGTPTGVTVRLGRDYRDEDLATDASTADWANVDDLRRVAHDADADDPGGAPAVITRLRLAGRTGDPTLLRSICRDDRPWPYLDDKGEPGSSIAWDATVADRLRAPRWGTTIGDIAADIAETMLGWPRPAAALDIVDAALLSAADENHAAVDALRTLRVRCLRALGRIAESDAERAATAGVDRVDEETAQLLFAIRKDPDDDQPRLRYAARVARTHPAHAALIRAQCAEPDAPDTPDQATVDELQTSFLATLSESLNVCRTVRGFDPGGSFDVDAKDFLSHHDLLFRVRPEAESLELRFASDVIDDLMSLAAIARYRELSFYDTTIELADAASIASSPWLRDLVSLSLVDTNIDDDALRVIIEARAYPTLEELDLSGSRSDEQSWTIEGLTALPSAAFASTLTSLRISGRWLGDDVIPILAELPNLDTLELRRNLLTDDGLAAVGALPHPLRTLDISAGGYGGLGLTGLTGSPHANRLEELTVGSDDLTDADWADVVASPTLTRLRVLDVEGSWRHRPGPLMAAAFAQCAFFGTLERLDLESATVGATGAAAIAEVDWRSLTLLDLTGNDIGDEGVIALASSPSMANLRGLILDRNRITDRGALAIARSPHLGPLDWLRLGDADISPGALDELRRRFPGVWV